VVEHQRALLRAERNHLGRELHDVLAHTLSALAVQLEALDSVISGGAPAQEVQQQMDRSKTLVREGLAEARRAVHALRASPAPLLEQVSALTEADGADLSVAGDPRPLSPEVSHALYRAAQEALANVAKYGGGAKATVSLRFEPRSVRLEVTNPGPTGDGSPGPAAVSAGNGGPHGGYGLQGMRERALGLGGTAQAGPDGPDGLAWRVQMELPG
jgi:signal transduction histidine kinase